MPGQETGASVQWVTYPVRSGGLTGRPAAATVAVVGTNGDVVSTWGDQITERIKDISREQGISGRELGRRLGKSHGWLSGLYSGRQPYDLGDLAAIAKELAVPIDHLLGTGAYATAAGYLPPPVQRLVDAFAESLLRRYTRPGVTAGQRRALLRVVTEAWKYVERGMTYWEQELGRSVRKEPGFGDTKPSRPRAG